MKLKQQYWEEEEESCGRFLVRHTSSSGLNIFACCSSSANLPPPLPDRPQHKISIKGIRRGGAEVSGWGGSQSISNYHTTNVIVEKYIVHPQNMTIFLKPHPPAEEDKEREKEKEREREAAPLRDSNNCHVSFGQQQAESLRGKFAGFREVSSNRPSAEAGRVEAVQGTQPNRRSLSSLVRDVEVMDEMEDSGSEQSEVIESYQNIMSRIQDRTWQRSADG